MIHPREVPGIRDELLEWLQQPARPAFYRMMGQKYGWCGAPGTDEMSDFMLRHEIAVCRSGELFYVNEDMTTLAEAAGRTIPSFKLLIEDLPSPVGVLLFDRPIGSWTDDDGAVSQIVGCGWARWFGHEDSLLVHFYTWRDLNLTSRPDLSRDGVENLRRIQPRLVHDTEAGIRLGAESDLSGGTIMDLWGRTVLAAWMLMQQPGLARHDPWKPTKLDRAWLKRRRIPAGDVTVVRLRYQPHDVPAPGSLGGREYQHRWVVRGHWRRQYYPSRGSHMPIWINPHIKGPEGAPLKTGERVNAWVR